MSATPQASAKHPEIRAGYTVEEYFGEGKQVPICRASYYNLPAELRPRSITIGRRRIIIEEPRAYLDRLAAAQQAEAA